MLHVSPIGLINVVSGYTVNNAIWLADGDYLSRTVGTPDNADEIFMACWIKRSSFGAQAALAEATNSNLTLWRFMAQDDMNFRQGATERLETSQVFRDPTAWMHVAFQYNSNASGGSGDYHRFFVNGVEVTAFNTDTPTSAGTDCDFNVSGTTLKLFRDVTNNADNFIGYVAEFICLDGQTEGVDFNISDICTTDANGNPIPVNPSGLTFGSNGFWLDFAVAPGTGNGAGTDVSGNGNNFTENSLTAAQQVEDTPTDDAANGVGNYMTWCPLSSGGNGSTFANGNQQWSDASAGGDAAAGTIQVSSGKWICEFEIDAVTTGLWLGVWDQATDYASTAFEAANSGNDIAADHGTWVIKPSTGFTIDGDGQGDPGTDQSLSTWTATDRMTIAIDMDQGDGSNRMWIAKNGTWENSGNPDSGTGTIFSNLPNKVVFVVGNRGSGTDTVTMRANSADWEDSPSNATTFKDIHTANLPAPTVTDPSAYFQSVLYTGNGTAIGSGGKAVTLGGNATMQPDFVWIKNRDAADEHMIYDAVRGATKDINSDSTSAEATDTEGLSTFDSDGFTVGSNVAVNTNTEKYVAWCMKAGGAGSSNANGTISSTVSVADHGGFSIATYAGNGTGGATVGHGLSSAPGAIIVKNRDQADSWAVYHDSNTSAPETDYLLLDTNAATADDNTFWNDTAPAATVFSVGTAHNVNASTENYVAYCFARTPGLIGIGSYTGNASTDGPYVVVDDGGSGFRPAWLMVKRTDSAGVWQILDNQRSPYNPAGNGLLAEDTLAESENSAHYIDFLANGFKLRTSDTDRNASGGTYIYLAFAEYPFGGSGVAQARAR